MGEEVPTFDGDDEFIDDIVSDLFTLHGDWETALVFNN